MAMAISGKPAYLSILCYHSPKGGKIWQTIRQWQWQTKRHRKGTGKGNAYGNAYGRGKGNAYGNRRI
jgi:hypothetical protein